MAFPLGRQLKGVLGPLKAQTLTRGLAAWDGKRRAAVAGPGFLPPGRPADLRWAPSTQVTGFRFAG